MSKLAHTLVSGRWCLFAFHPSSWAVERLNNLHRNIFCFMFRFLARSFGRFFKRSSCSPMVLSSRSRCMILTMVGQFDHLLPTLRLICGVLGRKSIPWLPVLPSRKVVRKRLVLDQIPILLEVKCSGERDKTHTSTQRV